MTSQLFVGSYGPADEPGIYAFTLDESTNELRLQGTTAGIRNASYLTVHPTGDHLFAVSETGRSGDGASGAVHAFRIVRVDGAVDLVALNQRSSAGDYPCHLCIDAGGRWLVVSNYGTGNVAVLPIGAGGSLGEVVCSVQHSGRGTNPERQEGPHAHSAAFTPDNRFLIAADLGIDRLLIYTFDGVTGSLAQHGEAEVKSGAGPRHMAFHPDGGYLFVVNELDNNVTLYRYDGAQGSLRALDTASTLPLDAGESVAADVHVSRSGRHVYVSNRGHDTVAVFSFDPKEGIKRIVSRPCGGEWPRHFALALGESLMAVANRRSNEVSLLPLLDGGADIGGRAASAEVSQPACIVFV